MSLDIKITLSGATEADAAVSALANALERRGPMHAQIAVRGKQYTQDYLRGLNRHRSAARLGATPTGHLEKSAAAIEAASDDQAALIRIPRRTGLGRAFADVTLRPGPGRKFLTIPAHQTTYGKSVRDFPDATFRFVVLQSFRVYLTLMFASGPYEGEVGYWLKKQVTQKQDRTLLPSDTGYAGIARIAAVEYLTELVEKGGTQ